MLPNDQSLEKSWPPCIWLIGSRRLNGKRHNNNWRILCSIIGAIEARHKAMFGHENWSFSLWQVHNQHLQLQTPWIVLLFPVTESKEMYCWVKICFKRSPILCGIWEIILYCVFFYKRLEISGVSINLKGDWKIHRSHIILCCLI